ncbi:hypothetical protein [Rhizobium sp. Root483D2]|uniref:hypothetical protein n=1 Tax=Rhizobium sp. Root483D2 TaxID=1736545 RepID=UPI000715D59D|nr:hypothetical protein [Rhizobium sp. Root483D2]KQY20776.1 hypothetical protein ASD32_05010 [Rhizobium sp. Root483D2]
MSMLAETMSKGDFAAHIRVSPGRISQYITEGKLTGDALDGEGRKARIRTAVALQQLSRTLDPAQRFGANGAATIAPVMSVTKPQTAPSAAPDPVVDEIAQERLKQQRLKTAREQRDEDLSTGRYMLTDAARRETGRAVSEAFKVMDQAIQEMAKTMAAQFGVPQRDALLALHKAMRDTRAKQAAAFREVADQMPELIEDCSE